MEKDKEEKETKSKEKCQSCEENDCTDLHTCPFAEEIHNDENFKCNCCEKCTQECANDV